MPQRRDQIRRRAVNDRRQPLDPGAAAALHRRTDPPVVRGPHLGPADRPHAHQPWRAFHVRLLVLGLYVTVMSALSVVGVTGLPDADCPTPISTRPLVDRPTVWKAASRGAVTLMAPPAVTASRPGPDRHRPGVAAGVHPAAWVCATETGRAAVDPLLDGDRPIAGGRPPAR
jgi:hypothetical protein